MSWDSSLVAVMPFIVAESILSSTLRNAERLLKFEGHTTC
jgi:hypothetical protein